MYKVVNKMTKGTGVAYAVLAPDGSCEIVSESDLKLLAVVGFEMNTISGSPVRITGGTLECDVQEYAAEDEAVDETPEDGDEYYDLYGDDQDGGEAEQEPEDTGEYDDIYGETGDEEVEEEDDGGYDDIYGADDEGGIDETKVAKLYYLLTQDQITILRRYYLWFSQRLFEGSRGSGLNTRFSNVNAANRKKEALDKLRGDKDFRYAGFVDTGSINAGYCCSLGHHVRYMHLAWNVKAGDIDVAFFGQMYNDNFQATYPDYWNVINSDECLVFGINCIGDFFDVDEECLDQLKRAQRQSLKDMAEMYDIMSGTDAAGLKQIKDTFKLMDEVMSTISILDLKNKLANKPTVMPLMVSFFYKQFRDADILPPKSLIQEVRSCLVGWTDGKKYFKNQWSRFLKYPEQSFYDRLKVLVKKPNYGVVDSIVAYSPRLPKLSFNNNEVAYLAVYVYLMFTYEICGHYKYTATKEGYHDEGGSDKRLVLAPFTTYYKSSLHNYFESADFSMATLLKLFEFCRLCIERLSTYKVSKDNFKLPYFSKSFSGATILEVSVFEQGYNDGPISTVRDILKKYSAASGEDLSSVTSLVKLIGSEVNSHRSAVDNVLSINFYKSHPSLEACHVGTWSNGYRRLPKYNLDMLISALTSILADFDALFSKLQAFAKSTADAEMLAYEEEKRLEAERKAAEAEEAKRMRAFEEGDKALKAIEDGVTLEHFAKKPPATPSEVVEYLNAKGVDSVTDEKLDFAKTILGTVLKSGKAPSDKQFYYIRQLYEAVSGDKYAGTSASGAQPVSERVKLEERPDIKDAIEWMNFAPVRAKAIAQEQGVADYDLLCKILKSISRYGTISEKQMKYAEMALSIAKEGKM